MTMLVAMIASCHYQAGMEKWQKTLNFGKRIAIHFAKGRNCAELSVPSDHGNVEHPSGLGFYFEPACDHEKASHGSCSGMVVGHQCTSHCR